MNSRLNSEKLLVYAGQIDQLIDQPDEQPTNQVNSKKMFVYLKIKILFEKMSRYICNRCNYESFSKKNAERHINKLKSCRGDGELKLNIVKDVIVCDKCNKSYETYDSLKRHQRTSCKVINEEKLQIENRKLKEKIEELEKLSKSATSNTTTTNTNSNNTNTTNNITNTQINNNYITISLTPYNDPNMEGMQQYLEAAVRKTFLSVPNLIESVHFNKEYPENQNICITNRRTKDAKVFDGKKWKTVNKDLLINEMVDTYERELTTYAEEQGKTKYIKDYESAKRRGNGEKDLKEEVHNVIYDNSEMVNTKIKEVQKPVKETQKIEQDPEETESVTSSEVSAPVDEYAEYQKLIDDSESEEESEE